MSLETRQGEAARDIVLPICYRNPPWTLATAHALGFGIYRRDGLVQHFDEPTVWQDIGYEVLRGRLEHGSSVALQRRADSYPDYFPQFIAPDDAVRLQVFDRELAQDDWVSAEIAENLKKDELEPDDILVVLPDAYTAKRRAARFARTLAQHGIDSHLVGVGSSVDEVFLRDSIAIAHIYRAKGNEAPMVYVLDAQYAAGPANLLTRRNTLFTALTRSRAWVRVSGWGERMQDVAAEMNAVRGRDFKLEFKVPTPEELVTLRRVHRERSSTEAASLKRAQRSVKDSVEAFERGEVEVADLPPNYRTRLLSQLREDPSGEGEY